MLTQGAEKVLECFGVKSGESVLIVVDTLTPLPLGRSLFECAEKMGCEAMLMTMLPRTHHGEEPPEAVAEAMSRADVVIAPTTFSLTHTKAKMKACKAGTRFASMPGVTEKMMTSGGMTADYDRVREIAIRLHARLKNARTVKVTSESGTDILFDVKGCKWMMDTGLCREPGCSSNLPAGELYIAPEDANGVFIVDGSMGGLGILESPLEFTVRNRHAAAIAGKRAGELIAILDSVGEKARNIAELGIGINPHAQLIGNVLEDEKVGGTVHIALGDSSNIGGDVAAGIHLDGIITKPRVFVDGEEFILSPDVI